MGSIGEMAQHTVIIEREYEGPPIVRAKLSVHSFIE